jgi:FkbM family methyltransferase
MDIQIRNEHDEIIDISQIEINEQNQAKKYIEENDIVLELGARYGSVSCTINCKLSNKNNQVVVEPDQRVWEALEKNKTRNNCEFHIIKGFISKQKMDLVNLHSYLNGYGSTFRKNINSTIPNFTLDSIIEKYNLTFNVLVADCEGFLEIFLNENPRLYKELRLIIFEADYPNKCNYKRIENMLSGNNFKKIVKGHQNVWIKSTEEYQEVRPNPPEYKYRFANEKMPNIVDKSII